MTLNRKNLHDWVSQHMGQVIGHRDNKLSSAYLVAGPVDEFIVVAINKRARLSDYTRMRRMHEIGVNTSIWERICEVNKRIRFVVCYQGRVWLHQAEDVTHTDPDIRYVYGQDSHDPRGVAWWPADDFFDATEGLTTGEKDPAPQAAPEAPNVLDLFGA